MASNPNLARLDALEATIADLRIANEQLQERVGLLENHRDQHREMLIGFNQWRDKLRDCDDAPIWTERINTDSTVKDGYRVKEATVTVANAKGDDATREERRRRLAELIEDGEMVAAERNHEREQAKRFA